MYENPFRKIEQKFYENVIRKIADISSAQDNAVPVSTIGFNKTGNYETMSTEELRERGANGDQEAIAEWKRRIIERNQPQEEVSSEPIPDETPEKTVPTEPPKVEGQEPGTGEISVKPEDEAQSSSMQAFFDYLDRAQKRVEEREDTAIQRYVEDAKRSGVNPNLFGSLYPASSAGVYGAGISASGNMTTANINNIVDRIMQNIELEFKMSENEKDRVAQIINTTISGLFGLGSAGIRTFGR